MGRNIDDIRAAFEQGEQLEYLFFWGHTPSTDGNIHAFCLSQWYLAEFIVDDVKYANAEQFMMARKAQLFNDNDIFDQIIRTTDPKSVKALGRKVREFDERVWKENRFEIIKIGNVAKFTQNKQLGEFLLATGDKILVEASPYDRIWGIGMGKTHADIENPLKWRGQNLLGFALMEVRREMGM